MQLKSLEGMRFHYSYNDRKEVYGARKEKRSRSAAVFGVLVEKDSWRRLLLDFADEAADLDAMALYIFASKGNQCNIKMIFSSFFTPDKRMFIWVHKLPSFVYLYHNNNEH